MVDIAELGYSVDSSGLVEGTKALDDNAAAAEKVSGATDRLERDYQALARTVERSSSVLGDRLGGALDRIGTGTGAVIGELQLLNRTNTEILASLGALDGKLAGTTGQVQAYGAAGKAAAAAEREVTTGSQQMEAAIAAQEARFRAVAVQAVAYAESMRGANLSERALAEAARESTSALNSRVAVMANAGTAQERMTARAKDLQEAEARATNQAREAARAAEAQKLNLQQLLGQIDPTVASLNRLAAMEERLERAHRGGMLNTAMFDQYQARLDSTRASVLAAANAQNRLGLSSGELRQGMRMLPAQITDITTSLVSGQPAWMVAIQQGGQLKDQFGGIGPAARAVGGYIVGLVNPLTVGAAALATLGAALYAREKDLREFNGALLLTGGYAGVMVSDLDRLTARLDAFAGVTRGGAMEALTAVAATGKFTGEQFDLVSAAAARMEGAVGQSLDSTIRKFMDLGKEPVEALLKLNETEHFLTRAQLDRVIALDAVGKSTEAVSEATRIYAQHIDDVASRSREALPAVAVWWDSIKDAASGAWGEAKLFADLMARIGSQASSSVGLGSDPVGAWWNMQQQQLKWLRGGVADAASRSLAGAGITPNASARARMPTNIEDQVDSKAEAERRKVIQENEAERKAASEALNGKLAGLDREAAKRLAVAKIVEMYNKIDVDRFDEEGRKLAPDSRLLDGSMQRLMARSSADVDRQFNKRDGVGKKNADDGSAQNLLATAQRQIEANRQLVETGQKVTESERQAAKIQQELGDKTNTMTASTRALLVATRDQLLLSGQKSAAYQKEQEAAEALARQQAILVQAGSNRERSNELDLMGMGRGSDGVAMLRRQLDIQKEYQEELKRIGSRDVAKDKETWDLLAANADNFRNQELGKERAFQEQRLAMLGDWRLGAQVAWQNYAFDATNYNQQAQDAVQNTLATTTSSIASQFDELIRGNQSLGESFKNIAVDMGNAVVGALEQMAAQWLVYKAIQLAVGDSASVSASSALVGNAAATAAQAALAAYASTAAIPIVGPAMAPAAAQAALSATAPYVAAVAAASTIGMAHDGINSVPREGTWLLDKGERVLTAGTAAKMDATLDRIAAGGGAGGGGRGNVTYAPVISVNGDPDARTLQLVESAVSRGMNQTYNRVATDMATGHGKVANGLRNGNNVSRRVR